MKKSSLIGILSEKDKESRITECNDVFLEVAGAKTEETILGHTDYDFPWANYAAVYRQHEMDALAGNNYSAIIPFTKYDGTEYIFLHNKIQKKDALGNIIGVSCHAIEIVNPNIFTLMQLLNVNSREVLQKYFVSSNAKHTDITKRQKEILFYLSRGKSPKFIARLLGLAVRTVEYYIELIKVKLNCRTRYELIEYAIQNEYVNNLPDLAQIKKIIEALKE